MRTSTYMRSLMRDREYRPTQIEQEIHEADQYAYAIRNREELAEVTAENLALGIIDQTAHDRAMRVIDKHRARYGGAPAN